VITEISPRDDMYRGNPDFYFRCGSEAIERIRESGIENPKRILDFACGHGRVLRALKDAFPKAHLTACDIDHDAVDFCAQTFGAEAIYSTTDGASFKHDFDLIWSGSLFTHLDAGRFVAFLELLDSSLATGGLLVFTTNGDHCYDFLRRLLPGDTSDPDVIYRAGRYFPIPKDAVPSMLSAYETGFAYADYEFMENFGATLSSPAWVREQLRRLNLRVVTFAECGWGEHQDVFACQSEPA
jgi:SAM-dependent methyltransferase